MQADLSNWITAAAVGVAVFFIKRWMNDLQGMMRGYAEQQRQCQLSLASSFRTKADAKDDSDKQWHKIDNHGERLTRVETLLEQDGRV